MKGEGQSWGSWGGIKEGDTASLQGFGCKWGVRRASRQHRMFGVWGVAISRSACGAWVQLGGACGDLVEVASHV
jgi:hypothetical protein